MGWNAETERERQRLQRVVAMLFALADLADCAAYRSFAVRALVLWILRPAADFTLNFVIREAQLSGAPMPVLPTSTFPLAGNDRADAHHLAACFRILALALAQCLVRMSSIAALRAVNRRLALATQEILQKLRCVALEAPPRLNAFWDTS